MKILQLPVVLTALPLIACMTAIGINHSHTSPVHGVNEAIDKGHRNTSPHSLICHRKFSSSCRSWLLTVKHQLNVVPLMFNRVEIGAKCWPVQNCDVVLLQVVPSYPCCMCTRIILLECLVWMPVEMWYNMGCQDLITIASSRYTISSAWTKILEDNRTKF